MTRRTTVRAWMKQYVWRDLMQFATELLSSEKNDGVTKLLAPAGLVRTHVAG